MSRRYSKHLGGIAVGYFVTIGLILYLMLQESWGARIAFWNCFPSTLALVVYVTGLGKSIHRLIVSAVFAIVSVGVMAFFLGMWLFMPLDTDSHSITTALVFVFAPLWSIGMAIIAAAITWLAMRFHLQTSERRDVRPRRGASKRSSSGCVPRSII